ncbi:hypothetical protein [Cytobacillus purgationiresistens]|uniref:DUF4367 domain-containing protein n=1 Tax=Cytobacillus purgationiresistens TaxID=863449 RepID=A0ABU0AK88_9BACI|nr:hypothetical protein [Cytobacillus purgationiresistens]MDQ0271667.1 hypothetical protein [Cytobacillus purgationiresistens]
MNPFKERNELDSSFSSMSEKVHLSKEEQDEIWIKMIRAKKTLPNRKRKPSKWVYFIQAGSAAIIILILIMPFINNQPPLNVDSNEFDRFFHNKMQAMHNGEKDYEYLLVHTQFNRVQKGDAIAVFKEYTERGEQIFIAYLKKENNKWEWKQTRGAAWDTPVKWSAMNEFPYIYSGALSDQNVTAVYAGEEEAEIIEVEKNKRFWFAISPIAKVKVKYKMKDGTGEIIEEKDESMLLN